MNNKNIKNNTNIKYKSNKYIKSYINLLFENNLSLVDGLINKLYKYSTNCMNKDDLRQVGLMGLYQAAKNYDKSKGTKFTTFATYYILGEIKKELRENKLIKYNKEVYKINKLLNEGKSIKELKDMGFSSDNIYLGLSYNDNNLINIEDDKLESLSFTNKRETFFDKIKDILPNDLFTVIKYKYLFNFSQSKISKMLNCSQSKISRMEYLAINILKKNYY